MEYLTHTNALSVQWKLRQKTNYKENKDMKKNKKFWDTLIAVLVLVVYLSVFSCRVSSIPSEGCCSTSGVKDTSVKDTEVNFDLVKKDGIVIILPTITTDTIK